MIVIGSNNASPNHLKRRLGISYNAAHKLVTCMERMRIVSAADERGRRKVRVPLPLAAPKPSEL